MSAASKKNGNASDKGPVKVGRGTSDEIEVLRTILDQEPMLMRKVRDRIKVLLEANKETAVDSAKRKHDQRKA